MTDSASPVNFAPQAEAALPKETAKETSLFWTLMTPVTFTGRMIKNVVVFTFVTVPSAIFSAPGKIFNAVFGKTETTEEELPAENFVGTPSSPLEDTTQEQPVIQEQPAIDEWAARFERGGAAISAVAQSDTAFSDLSATYRGNQSAATPTSSPRVAQSTAAANFAAPVVSPEEQAQIDKWENRGRQPEQTFSPVALAAALNGLELAVHPERATAASVEKAPGLASRFFSWLNKPVGIDDLR